MLCIKCNKSFSDTVYPLHRCKPQKEVKSYTEDELREMAKEKGISNYWNKKEENLLDELGL